MQIKSELRKEFKQKRAGILDKSVKDRQICLEFLKTDLYRNSAQILSYFPYSSEIDTSLINERVLADGKQLYLPRCADKDGNMDFYRVESLNNLCTGAYGIREPDPGLCAKASYFSGAVCVVPGLSFDRRGFRLGYGKGYYDRFLEKFTIITVGLCYNELLSGALPADAHDVPVDYIALQDSFIKV